MRHLYAYRLGFLSILCLFLGLGFTATLSRSITAQEMTATPAPTSAFDLIFPTSDPFLYGTPTALPSISGVGGVAERAAVIIRSGPSTSYSRIGALRQGGSIDIIGYNGYDLERNCGPDFAADLDMWVLVQFGTRRGWMARCALTIRGEHNMPYLLNNFASDS